VPEPESRQPLSLAAVGGDRIVTHDELVRALMRAGAPDRCACGHNLFMPIGAGGEVEPFLLISKLQADLGDPGGVLVAALSCERCGFVRMHRLDRLDFG